MLVERKRPDLDPNKVTEHSFVLLASRNAKYLRLERGKKIVTI